jgi:hypothetical protein
VLISIDPAHVLFGIFFIYALSGPVLTVVQLHHQRRLRLRHGGDQDSSEPPA